ncbi:MAG: hypothetical protein IRY99_09375 [Isosphaeraceae bacterium]|nr:hypothetical protein [Isosphaeraceae bacterium]
MAGRGAGLIEKAGRRPAKAQRLTILGLMALIAGVVLGLWIVAPDLREPKQDWEGKILLTAAGVLGGLALLGPPILLWERRGRRGLWRAGRVLWFASGMASWLLWPPVIVARGQGRKFADTTSGVCFAYGTPLMAVYVTLALLAGGWLRPRRRRAKPLEGWERFGLILALAWACTGAYVLYLLYRQDLFKR